MYCKQIAAQIGVLMHVHVHVSAAWGPESTWKQSEGFKQTALLQHLTYSESNFSVKPEV